MGEGEGGYYYWRSGETNQRNVSFFILFPGEKNCFQKRGGGRFFKKTYAPDPDVGIRLSLNRIQLKDFTTILSQIGYKPKFLQIYIIKQDIHIYVYYSRQNGWTEFFVFKIFFLQYFFITGLSASDK